MLIRLLRDTLAVRVAVAVLVGVAVAAVVAGHAGWRYALAGWVAAAAVYVVWTWTVVWPMDATSTALHATREDPTRMFTDILVVVAAFGSLGGVGYLLIAGSSQSNQAIVAAAVGVVSVVAAWVSVHTLFTLHYARLYYIDEDGGINFNQQEPPCYPDFAYVAFTIGMTYQVSDTDIQDSAIRKAALRHALVSFVLGAIILAVTVNLIAGLSSKG
ncbi:DUF1345 domain-containing protein [Mycobacterium sp.]|jgi:uncharacterized membrane protein|uniref:DUF1345 domain-containing protein n=1 Tax=Mycobacterium sp. TaxID=1785 RepID=UPI002D383754|nr:DUF1345 domain-containing protein [Mycobacterium sp.]HZA09945.1 DUF1345 domain-containing protein [Mycobacterium sp.]